MFRPVLVVALTGGIGSGKSTVAELFAQVGAHIVDTDAIAHTLTGQAGRALPPILKLFGHGVFDSEGAVDRSLMRISIFGDAHAKTELEAILHPMIRDDVRVALASEAAHLAPYVMLAVPLLFETMGYRRLVQRTLVVDCPIDTQRQRVKRRSGLPIKEIDQILAAQLFRLLRLQLADDVVSNSRHPENLPSQVAVLHERYQTIAGAKW